MLLKERDKQLQNHLIGFNNEPLAMDAPPLALSVPLHQSRALPAIPPTQTLPFGPRPSPEPRTFFPSAAREFLSTPLPQPIMNPPQVVLSRSGPLNIGSQPHTSTSAPAPAAVHHDSVDGWVNKLSPYTGTVFPRQTVGTRLEKSLLRLEHGRDTHKIELLRFDGSPIEWPTSIERFDEHVHNKPFSTDTQRMTQLQMHLDGQAKNLVEGLGCDGKGYAIALQTLKKRFGHRSLVARFFDRRSYQRGRGSS